MSGDEYSVSDSLWAQIVGDRLDFLVPLWIARRPESLIIMDYRPSVLGFLAAVGFVVLTVLFFLFLFVWETPDSYGLWFTGIPALVCLAVSLKGTIREAYYFDRTKDSYAFVRQFIYRREVIEGSLSQFTGAYVKTETHYNTQSDSYSTAFFVVLQQEGMFLTGVTEQRLREEAPMFNTHDREARIANAISGFLSSKG